MLDPGPLQPHPLPGVVGDLRHWPDLELPGLGRRAEVSVWLPPGYDTSEERYPVVYLHDGHNVFDPATSHTGATWRGDRAASWAVEQGRPAILVAVPCSPTRRAEEYTPVAYPEYGGGEADTYLHFLIQELKPAVDRLLRTRPGPEDTVVAGSSLGGLLSLYAWAQCEDVFGSAGVFSPAFWWAEQHLHEHLVFHLERHAASSPEPGEAGARRRRVYLDVGGREDPEHPDRQQAYVRDAEHFAATLRSAGVDLRYLFDSTAEHSEDAWAERLPAALTWLLGGPISRA